MGIPESTIEALKERRHYSGQFIGGSWQEPHSGEYIDSRNPASDVVWATIPAGNEMDVEDAVVSAKKTFESDAWRRLGGTGRAVLLRKLASAIDRDVERLAMLESLDNGKALRETRGQMAALAPWLEYFAGVADKLQGATIPINPDVLAYTVRDPAGVVAGILPWNSPAPMFIWKFAPAFAAGNTIIIKPSEFTSVTAFEIAKLCEEVGFPEGSLNVVSGLGKEVGAALVGHSGVDRVAFTGEGRTATEITRASAARPKRLNVELGGKAAQVIFADADYEQALSAVLEGAFIGAGQSCTCGSRVLVEQSLFDRLAADLARRADSIVVADPFGAGTQLGSQTTQPQLRKTESYVESARVEGAEIIAGGRRPVVAGLENGYFFRPTVIANVKPEMAVCREEIFGPVTAIMPFRTESEALTLANDTPYGLTAAVWTDDIRRAHRMARDLQVGTVWVNTFRAQFPSVPYGGTKFSGYGRENGLDALDFFTEIKSVIIDNRTSRASWF